MNVSILKPIANHIIENKIQLDLQIWIKTKNIIRINKYIVNNNKKNILQEVSALNTDFSSLKYECIDIEANSKPYNRKQNTVRFTIMDEDKNLINLDLNVLITLMFYKQNNI